MKNLETSKAVVFGSSGMLGTDLLRTLGQKSITTKGFNRTNFDIGMTPDQIAREIDGSQIVINALAYTNVDAAEANEDLANEVNGFFVGRLSEACQKAEVKLFHISTDYVFDGSSKIPYSVEDKTNPQTAYGRSKLLGEEAILATSANSSIFRTSWLYGSSGRSFPSTIGKRFLAGERIEVVDDQVGSPTWTRDLASYLVRYLSVEKTPRIIHANSTGACSWFEFAQRVASSMNLDSEVHVQRTSSSHFATRAQRPAFSVLNNSEGPLDPIARWDKRWLEAESVMLAALQHI